MAKALARVEGKAKRDTVVKPERNAEQIRLDCLDNWNTKDFFKSATRGDVQHCLDAGADPNAQDEDGETPLHWAAAWNVEGARVLLDAGADPNAQDEDGETPLHWAAAWNVEGARVLLDAGADPNAQDEDGETPLHWAARKRKNVQVVRSLLDAGADLNAQDEDGETPLHIAAYYGRVEVVRVLLDAGADIESKEDIWGRTSLHKAGKGGKVEVVRVLLNAGADPNAQDEEGETPLHIAAEDNETEVALILIAAGADIETKDITGQAPDLSFLEEEDLAKALARVEGKAKRDTVVKPERNAEQIRLDCLDNWKSKDFFKNATRTEVQHCLEAGAPLGVYSLRRGSTSALHQAVEHQNVEAVQTLIAADADPNAKVDHYVPLQLAAEIGNVEVVEVLLEAGTRFWELYPLKMPLELALEFDNHDVFMLLVDVEVKAMLGVDGFDIMANAVRGAVVEGDLNAALALIKASYKGYGTNSLALNYISSHKRPYIRSFQLRGTLGAVKALIAAGADPNALNNQEETPLHGAAGAGNIEVIEVLLAAGADVNASQPNWGTPLHYVIELESADKKGAEVALILIAAGADIEAKKGNTGQTPLMLAKQFKRTEIIKILLEAGGELSR